MTKFSLATPAGRPDVADASRVAVILRVAVELGWRADGEHSGGIGANSRGRALRTQGRNDPGAKVQAAGPNEPVLQSIRMTRLADDARREMRVARWLFAAILIVDPWAAEPPCRSPGKRTDELHHCDSKF